MAKSSSMIDEKEIANIKADVMALRSDISALVASLGANVTSSVKDGAGARLSEASETAHAQAEAAAKYATDMRDSAAETIRDKPGMALGVAVGAGFLAGLMFGKK